VVISTHPLPPLDTIKFAAAEASFNISISNISVSDFMVAKWITGGAGKDRLFWLKSPCIPKVVKVFEMEYRLQTTVGHPLQI